MGSGSKKTQTYRPPSYIESGAKQATALARQYASTPYKPYQGERVAPLSSNEQQGYEMASAGAGQGMAALEGAKARFTDADIQAYMNPYIKGALDPAAREIREEGARRLQDVRGQAASRGAFSGSRAILAEREAIESTDQTISDLYGRGYAEAFNQGSALWQADQDRALKIAGMTSDLLDADVRRLMSTGETARMVEQMANDFDYQQFTEARDWSGKNAAYLTDVLRGLKGSYTEVQETKKKGNALGQILGAATTIAGAYFTGGGSLLAQGAAKVGGGAISENVQGAMDWGG